MSIQPTNTTKLKNTYKSPKLLVYGGMAKTTTAGSTMLEPEKGNGKGQTDKQRP